MTSQKADTTMRNNLPKNDKAKAEPKIKPSTCLNKDLPLDISNGIREYTHNEMPITSPEPISPNAGKSSKSRAKTKTAYVTSATGKYKTKQSFVIY